MADLKDLKIDPERLRAARGERTQTEVAEKIGVTRQHIWNWESGTANPPSPALAQLCLLYGVSVESLTNAQDIFLQNLPNAA